MCSEQKYCFSEAFIADHGGNLVALDLRTGRVLYTYAGLYPGFRVMRLLLKMITRVGRDYILFGPYSMFSSTPFAGVDLPGSVLSLT